MELIDFKLLGIVMLTSILIIVLIIFVASLIINVSSPKYIQHLSKSKKKKKKKNKNKYII